MKCLNDMKKAYETLVKRQMEKFNAQLNEVKAAKHKQQTQTLPNHDNSRSVKGTSREAMLNCNQSNHQNQKQQQQQQQHHQQQQPHEQQHMQNSRSCHETPRRSMQILIITNNNRSSNFIIHQSTSLMDSNKTIQRKSSFSFSTTILVVFTKRLQLWTATN